MNIVVLEGRVSKGEGGVTQGIGRCCVMGQERLKGHCAIQLPHASHSNPYSPSVTRPVYPRAPATS